MVLPAIVLAAGAAGAGGAALGSLSSSGSKTVQNRKEVQVQRTYQPTVNRTTTTTDNRQYTFAPQSSRKVNYNPQVVIDSPDAAIGSKLSQKSKKGGVSPEQKAPVTTPVVQRPRSGGDQRTGDQGATASSGGDKMVLLGAAVAGAYLLTRD